MVTLMTMMTMMMARINNDSDAWISFQNQSYNWSFIVWGWWKLSVVNKWPSCPWWWWWVCCKWWYLSVTIKPPAGFDKQLLTLINNFWAEIYVRDDPQLAGGDGDYNCSKQTNKRLREKTQQTNKQTTTQTKDLKSWRGNRWKLWWGNLYSSLLMAGWPPSRGGTWAHFFRPKCFI